MHAICAVWLAACWLPGLKPGGSGAAIPWLGLVEVANRVMHQGDA